MPIDAAARVLIIADDLTGALDTAGAFASRGIATKVIAEPKTSDAASVRDAQVVAVNTASRHLPAADAAVHMLQCARLLSTQHFDIVFKKIDSTLRGNVVVETETLMKTCGRPTALVAPAFPAQGRTVIDGMVHVEGVPLPDTGFAKDALSPPPLQPLGDVFADVVGQDRVMSWRPGQALTLAKSGVIIADAENDPDMSELFGKVAERVTQTLLVGSAGLGEMLAARLEGGAGQNKSRGQITRLEPVSDPIVFVVGSRAAAASRSNSCAVSRKRFSSKRPTVRLEKWRIPPGQTRSFCWRSKIPTPIVSMQMVPTPKRWRTAWHGPALKSQPSIAPRW